MKFRADKVRTTVNAGSCELYNYGYFANTLSALKSCVQNEMAGFKSAYSMLNDVRPDSEERRFGCPLGYFALYYPTDRVNNERY